MQRRYHHPSGAFLELRRLPLYNYLFVAALWVPPTVRGQGIASALKAQMLADADAEGEPVIATYTPQAGGMTEPELRAWFARLGYVPWPPVPDLSDIRYPRIEGELTWHT